VEAGTERRAPAWLRKLGLEFARENGGADDGGTDPLVDKTDGDGLELGENESAASGREPGKKSPLAQMPQESMAKDGTAAGFVGAQF
jgi:hypothetical protein